MAQPVVVVSGASGLIGAALVRTLTASGHLVRRLVRRPPASGEEVFWDPAGGRIDSNALAGADAVVHLAGEPIGRRWTATRRRGIRDSRIAGTTLLARALAAGQPGAVLLSGSAVGYYGDRGDEALDEASDNGDGFLAAVCQEWEASTRVAADAGIRTVLLRTGLVLASEGGALPRMLLPFRLGLGGRLGHGRQWMSWIELSDVVRALVFLMRNSSVSGPVNLVAPNPVTNADFTTSLGTVLRRPAILPVPATALTIAFGQMARETLLASQRVRPRVLLGAGFEFDYPTIDGAIRQALAAAP